MEACFDHIRSHNGNLLWCNAGVIAPDFYKRMGFQTIGPEFEIEGIGAHYVMWREIA